MVEFIGVSATIISALALVIVMVKARAFDRKTQNIDDYISHLESEVFEKEMQIQELKKNIGELQCHQ